MDYIYRVAARQLFNVEVPEGPLPMRALRNTDFQEITLEVRRPFHAPARAFSPETRQAMSLQRPCTHIRFFRWHTQEFCICQPIC